MRLIIGEQLINYSAEVLIEDDRGMTWTQIARFFRRKSTDFNVEVPYANTIFPSHLSNRRAGFIENLKVFTPEQQVLLLRELCETNTKINVSLLKKMIMRYYERMVKGIN